MLKRFCFACVLVLFTVLPSYAGFKYDILCNAASIEDKTTEASSSFPHCVKAIRATSGTNAAFLEFEPDATYQDEGPLQPPTNLTTLGWFGSIILNWKNPEGQEDDNVEIWENKADDIATAENIATVAGTSTSYERCLGSFQGRYYWVRAISRTNIVSAWNSLKGTYGYSEQEGAAPKTSRQNTERIFTVYAKGFDGSFVQVYQTESDYDLNWYAFNVAKDSGYDLIHGDDKVTGYVVLCSEIKATPTPTVSPSAAPSVAAGASSGGGGCSVGFSSLLALLALPLLLKVRFGK